MNPNILGVIGPGFLNQVPTLGFRQVPEKKRSESKRLRTKGFPRRATCRLP